MSFVRYYVWVTACSVVIRGADTGDTSKTAIAALDKRVIEIISGTLRPDGLIDRQRLLDLNQFSETSADVAALGLQARPTAERIARVRELLPRASQILGNGYDPERYKKERAALEQEKSLYAQGLITAMLCDLKAAISVIEGYPTGNIKNPSPYDPPYDALVSQYRMFANRLEALGENPPLEALRILNQDFLTQFDRMLTSNDIGRGRKKVLIGWLGGENNYLGTIIGKMMIARSPGFPRSGFVPMA